MPAPSVEPKSVSSQDARANALAVGDRVAEALRFPGLKPPLAKQSIQSIESDVIKMIECDDVHIAYTFPWPPWGVFSGSCVQVVTGYTLVRDCRKSDYSSLVPGEQVRGQQDTESKVVVCYSIGGRNNGGIKGRCTVGICDDDKRQTNKTLS